MLARIAGWNCADCASVAAYLFGADLILLYKRKDPVFLVMYGIRLTVGNPAVLPIHTVGSARQIIHSARSPYFSVNSSILFTLVRGNAIACTFSKSSP